MSHNRLRLCSAVLASALLSVSCSDGPDEQRTRATASPSYAGAPVILISIDTLRADHLPAYGYRGVNTPAIDAVAADGIVFEDAWSNVPLTLPSHVTILTGETPDVHGVRNNVGYPYDPSVAPPVTAALRAGGYASGAAVSSWVLRGDTGLERAFDFYEDTIPTTSSEPLGASQRSGEATLAAASPWIDEKNGQPFFFLLHLFEPHAPYSPPPPWDAEYSSTPYDGEIAAADAVVARAVLFLKSTGIYDRCILIILSDHGEGLGDHGEDEHGIFLYREALHVPLIIKLPSSARAGERVSRPVQLADLSTTITQAVGADASRPGLSLLDTAVSTSRTLYAETLYPRFHLGWSELRSLYDSQYHYIEAPRAELYDVANDPGERRNMISDDRRAFARLKDAMASHAREIKEMSPVSREEAARLAALGYVGSTVGHGDDLPDPKDRIDELNRVREATRLADSGHFEEAIERYRSVLKTNPSFADAWSLLAVTLDKAGRLPEATEAYQQKLRNCPGLTDETALALADLLNRRGLYDEAEAHAKLVSDRNASARHLQLGRIAFGRSNWKQSEREARLALAWHDAFTASAEVLLARAVAKQGRFDEALAHLDSVERRARQDTVELVDFVRGEIYASSDRPVEAERAFLREIERHPATLQAYSSLAILYFVSGRTERVRSTLDDMVARNPGPQSCNLAARTLEALGDRKGAEAWRKRELAIVQ